MEEKEPHDPVPSETAEEGGSLSVIVDAIGTYLGDIPAALKKNVARAFGQLVKIPGAWIDGKAAEIKAESDARVVLTKATAKSIARQIDVDGSVAAIAADTHASKILRQTVNSAKVLQRAAEEIKRLPTLKEEEKVAEISHDWLNAFEQDAVNMSSEQMQRLFGKILAGEIRRPSSYSIRTVKLMAQLDNQAAELFRKLCSLAVTLRIESSVFDSRVLTLEVAAGANGLQRFGLSFAELNILFEYGLIIGDYNSFIPYHGSIVRDNNVGLPLSYMNQRFALMPRTEMGPAQVEKMKFYGVALSRAGCELIDIVDIEEDTAYSAELKRYLSENKGVDFVPVSG
jgi:hypothetical protein